MLSYVRLKNSVHLEKDTSGHGVSMALRGAAPGIGPVLHDKEWLMAQSGSVLVIEHRATGSVYKLPFAEVAVALEAKAPEPSAPVSIPSFLALEEQRKRSLEATPASTPTTKPAKKPTKGG